MKWDHTLYVRCMTCGWVLADPSRLKNHAGHQLRSAANLSCIERIKLLWWNLRDQILKTK